MEKQTIYNTLAIISVVIMVFLLCSAGFIAYASQAKRIVCAPVTQYYTEQEPYTVQDCKNVLEPVVTVEPLKYDVLSKTYYDYFWTSHTDVNVIIQNTDNQGGKFWLTFKVTTSKGTFETTTEKLFLASGQKSYTFTRTFSGNYVSSTITVHSENKEKITTKTKTECTDETKYRPTTKTRQVSQCNTIPKYPSIYHIFYKN